LALRIKCRGAKPTAGAIARAGKRHRHGKRLSLGLRTPSVSASYSQSTIEAPNGIQQQLTIPELNMVLNINNPTSDDDFEGALLMALALLEEEE